MQSLIMLVLASLFTISAYAERDEQPEVKPAFPVVYQNRIVKIDDVITYSKTQSIVNRLYSFDQDTYHPVMVAIDSVGGEVGAGMTIIGAIKHLKDAGIKVQCVVTGLAASMAAWIYLHCSERYATPSAVIMYHFGRIMIPQGTALGANELASLAKGLGETNNKMLADLKTYLPINPIILFTMLMNELFVPAKELDKATEGKFLKIMSPTPKFLRILGEKSTPSLSNGRPGRNVDLSDILPKKTGTHLN